MFFDRVSLWSERSRWPERITVVLYPTINERKMEDMDGKEEETEDSDEKGKGERKQKRRYW